MANDESLPEEEAALRKAINDNAIARPKMTPQDAALVFTEYYDNEENYNKPTPPHVIEATAVLDKLALNTDGMNRERVALRILAADVRRLREI